MQNQISKLKGKSKTGSRYGDRRFEAHHEARGCYNCSRANKKFLGKSACCTYLGQIVINKIGECFVREALY